MGFIKNYDSLATNPQRGVVLTLIESALDAIQPKKVMDVSFMVEGLSLTVKDHTYNLSEYEQVFVVGFGKGSSGICKYIEEILGDKLTNGWDIDVVDETFAKIDYTKGTHPLPSQTNVTFTEKVLENLRGLTVKDLVLVVICGGGSALFESPTIPLPRLSAVNTELLKSGATIEEMNAIRKHLSKVKGGGFAKALYPSKVVGLVFSDVPGNTMSVIASGPTSIDRTSIDHVETVVQKYQLQSVAKSDFIETPTEEKYFSNVENIIMVSNKTALFAMQQKAKELGKRAIIFTDRLQGNAKTIGKVLLSETKKGEILLAGGETTVHVRGKGTGGRNQTLVLAALPFIESGEVIAAIDSDGWDFSLYAGAVGDTQTAEKAKSQNLEIQRFLDNDNSTEFFQKTNDGIDTGKLESNVSDLFIVAKI